jgi:hypothetical protein
LLLFDDRRLPGWNLSQVEGLVRDIPGLEVYRILPAWAVPADDDLVDASGSIWSAWRPAGGTAALVRPDGHVGWMADRVSPEDLRQGVRRALGLVSLG